MKMEPRKEEVAGESGSVVVVERAPLRARSDEDGDEVEECACACEISSTKGK